nr:hypothetical protein [Agrobacterium fabrum]
MNYTEPTAIGILDDVSGVHGAYGDVSQYFPTGVANLMGGLWVSGRTANHVVRLYGKGLVANPDLTAAFKDDKHFFVISVIVKRERPLARREYDQIAAERVRTNQ